jgi:lipoyl(octanoyl) transferase
VIVKLQEPIGWKISDAPVDYPEAVSFMEQRVAQIVDGRARQLVWLLEHPALYTAGTSAKPEELLDAGRFPVFPTGRGGQFTYHGPGQRIGYVMIDLRGRDNDVRRFVFNLEEWLIRALDHFNIRGERRSGRVGIWVVRKGGREDKIAALGIRVRRGVSYHGVSLNIEPDLEHFSGIVPCGIVDHGVTSLADLGVTATHHDADLALRRSFESVFGVTADNAE